jgi:L,D-transpeptidase YcbB
VHRPRIAAGETKRAYLKTPMPVYLLYLTAFVDDDGTVEFRDDLYGRDLVLGVALDELEAKRRAANF